MQMCHTCHFLRKDVADQSKLNTVHLLLQEVFPLTIVSVLKNLVYPGSFSSILFQYSSQSSFACHILPNTLSAPCHRLTLVSDLVFPLGMLQCSRHRFLLVLVSNTKNLLLLDSLFFTCILYISSLINGYQKHIYKPCRKFWVFPSTVLPCIILLTPLSVLNFF